MGFWDSFFLILIGKKARETNRRNGSGGSETKGPEWKEKRRSLKEVSQVTMEETMAANKMEETRRGRRVKRERIGRRERSLGRPFGSFEDMK